MKKILGSILVSTTVLGFGLQASAVTVDEANRQVKSDASITITAGESTPTDPEDLDTPSGKTDQSGPLSIDNVITFNFQNMNLGGRTQMISLKDDGGTTSSAKRNVQVTDSRGTGKGWNLQIKQSELIDKTTTQGTTNTLKGAYITLTNGIVVAGRDNVAAQADASLVPTLDNYVANDSNKGDFQKVMTASEGKGMGTFKIYYNQDVSGVQKNTTDDIQLVVPSGSMTGTYEGTVTWALSDGPSGTPVK